MFFGVGISWGFFCVYGKIGFFDVRDLLFVNFFVKWFF